MCEAGVVVCEGMRCCAMVSVFLSWLGVVGVFKAAEV